MLDADAVHTAIASALSQLPADDPDEALSQREVQGLAFHLSDWLPDLEAFHAFARDPATLSAEQVQALLATFLARVPPHLGEAARIWNR